MLYIEKFYEREFRAENPKEAYLKACKFVASNIVNKGSKVEASKVTWDVSHVKNDEGLPTFRLTLYYKFDDTDFMQSTCNACKQFHKSFFINENYDCDRCKKVGYEKNIQQKLLIGSDYLRKLLDDELNKF